MMQFDIKQFIIRFLVITILFFLVITPFVFASNGGKYVVDKPDGSVVIINYKDGSKDSIFKIINELGFSEMNYRKISDEEVLPSRDDRDFWTLENDVITVDSVKKQAYLDKKSQDEAEKALIYEKMKITKEEWEKVKK